jgi:hypothetical protein
MNIKINLTFQVTKNPNWPIMSKCVFITLKFIRYKI